MTEQIHYTGTLQSVKQHHSTQWFDDAKFGIFVHWGLYSIPGYAPIGRGDINRIISKEGTKSFFTNIPYSEWYVNSIRIKNSPAWMHHTRTYGSDFLYESFAEEFKEESRKWSADRWADQFRDAGAKYVVLVAKHMDGFLMWPSKTPNYQHPGYGLDIDVVGDLTKAVKARDMAMGLYYSSALDLSFTQKPMADIVGLLSEGGPIDKTYANYQLSHWYELIDRYEPSLLWGDIAYPPKTNLYDLFAYFYNKNPQGVVNDRWGQLPSWLHHFLRSRLGRALLDSYTNKLLHQGNTGNIKPPHYDYSTPEFTVKSGISMEKWETCRGMGLGFGYNREEKEEDYITLPDLIRLLVDIVSKNGNLLLNVGPKPDGSIPVEQENLLRGIGNYLSMYGSAIYGTRPWKRAEGTTSDRCDLRFTHKSAEDGDTIYIFFMGKPALNEVTIMDMQIDKNTTVCDLYSGKPIMYKQNGSDLTLFMEGFPSEAEVPVVSLHILKK